MTSPTDRRKFVVPQEPIPENDIAGTFTADVIVVGAGTSGKAAALSAAEAGAKVIQIDKHVTFRWAGGMIGAVDSRLQKQNSVPLPPPRTTAKKPTPPIPPPAITTPTVRWLGYATVSPWTSPRKGRAPWG